MTCKIRFCFLDSRYFEMALPVKTVNASDMQLAIGEHW